MIELITREQLKSNEREYYSGVLELERDNFYYAFATLVLKKMIERPLGHLQDLFFHFENN